MKNPRLLIQWIGHRNPWIPGVIKTYLNGASILDSSMSSHHFQVIKNVIDQIGPYCMISLPKLFSLWMVAPKNLKTVPGPCKDLLAVSPIVF